MTKRTTWREGCAAIIFEAVRGLPPDATLEERTKRVDAARPYWVRRTSWGQKSWQAARRDYLSKFGYRKRGQKQATLPLFEGGQS